MDAVIVRVQLRSVIQTQTRRKMPRVLSRIRMHKENQRLRRQIVHPGYRLEYIEIALEFGVRLDHPRYLLVRFVQLRAQIVHRIRRQLHQKIKRLTRKFLVVRFVSLNLHTRYLTLEKLAAQLQTRVRHRRVMLSPRYHQHRHQLRWLLAFAVRRKRMEYRRR